VKSSLRKSLFLCLLSLVLACIAGKSKVQATTIKNSKDSFGNYNSVNSHYWKNNTAISRYLRQFFQEEKFRIKICRSQSIGKWELGESKRNLQIIKDRKYDLIVLPVQEVDTLYDRVARMMPARLIANEIKKRTGKKVMSPELALRILGRNQIIFDTVAVSKLSHQTGADVLYLLRRTRPDSRQPIYSPNMRPVSRYMNRGIKLDPNQKDNWYKKGWESEGLGESQLSAVLIDTNGKIAKEVSIDLGHENIRVFRRLQSYRKGKEKELLTPQEPLDVKITHKVNTLVNSLYTPTTTKTTKKFDKQLPRWTFPEKINQITGMIHSSIDNAVYLQLLALLTPETLKYEKHRLFERSLVALQNSDSGSKYYNLLKSRALFHLYRRPFAISYLESPSLPSEKALKAFLNGNLPEMRQSMRAIESPVLHTIAYLEFKKLRHEYKKQKKQNDILKVPNSAWQALLEASSLQHDNWYVPDNIEYFDGIKGLFPDFDREFAKAIKGATVVGRIDFSSNYNTLINEIFKLPEGISLLEKDASYDSELTQSDLWMLYRNIAIANTLKSIEFSSRTQSSLDTALEKIQDIAPLLNGHPAFSNSHAFTLTKLTKKTRGPLTKEYFNKAFQLSEEVLSNSCEVTKDTLEIKKRLRFIKNRVDKNHSASNILDDFIKNIDGGNYPSSFLIYELDKDERPSIKLIPFTQTKISALRQIRYATDKAAFENLISTRFNGHPEKKLLLADLMLRAGNKQQAIRFMQDEIDTGSINWDLYNKLAKIYIQAGQYKKASETWLKYPLFSNIPDDKHLLTSNNAYRAAGQLLVLGCYEEATPLLKIAASLRTGGSSQYLSTLSLSLFNEDYATVLESAYTNAKRYNHISSYNLYLIYLHVLGHNEDAEAGFAELSKRRNSNVLWTSQLVGDRVQSKDLNDVANWLVTLNGFERRKFDLLSYLASLAILDRVPEAHHVFIIKKFEKENNIQPVIPKDSYTSTLKIGLLEILSDINININDNHYSTFGSLVEVQSNFRKKEYNKCVETILFYLKKNRNRKDTMILNLVPYLLMSLSADQDNKRILKIENLLKNVHVTGSTGFYELLLQAIINGHLKRHDDALKKLNEYLKNHLHRSSLLHLRISGSYYYLLVSEWLYRNHDEQKYLDQAMEWAKRMKKMRPHLSWAQSFVALYSTSNVESVKSAAYAYHLDPESYWLSLVKDSTRKAAKKWLTENNPFIISEQQDADKEKKEDI